MSVASLLHGCRGGDAVAPHSVPPEGTAWSTAPQMVTVESQDGDTLHPGAKLLVTGRSFPSRAGSLSLKLNGVTLSIDVLDSHRLQASIPDRGFACTARGEATLVLQVDGVTIQQRQVPWRVARAVALSVGESRMLSQAYGECLELDAPDSARYLLSVVNTAVGSRAAPAMELRGLQAVESPAAPVMPAFGPAVSGGSALAVPHEQEPEHVTLTRLPHRAPRVAPAASRAPLAVHRTAVTVGDTLDLRVLYRSCALGTAVRAQVVYSGANTLVLEELPSGGAGHAATLRPLGDEFDRVMLPLLQRELGDPLAMESRLGGDGRVTLLFTRFVNDSLPGTAAYVHACNLYPRSQYPASNADALMYVRLPGAGETAHDYHRAVRSTLVHEGKHLASFAERLAHGREFEEPWLEEATARVAEELYARTFTGGGGWRSSTGFEASVGCELRECDGRPLVMWKHMTGLHAYLQRMAELAPFDGSVPSSNAVYAAGWSLVRWVLDQRVANERSALRALVSGAMPAGLVGVAALSGQDVTTLLAGWVAGVTGQTWGAPQVGRNGDEAHSWQLSEMWRGLAATFPGAFPAQPLAATYGQLGGGFGGAGASGLSPVGQTLVVDAFTGVARSFVLQAQGPKALLAVTPRDRGADGRVQLVVRRLP